VLTNNQINEKLKSNPLPIDYKATGLKPFQQHAFLAAYAALSER
jgi:hypothetical protein